MRSLANWRSLPMYYRRDGTAIWYGDDEASMRRATLEWAASFEKQDRHVANTYLPNGIHVSTVWLGLDHSFSWEGPPLIFESMAFAAAVNVHKASESSILSRDFEYHESLDCDRYTTEAEAAVGHVMMCLRWYPDVTHLLPEVCDGLEETHPAQIVR
jgi:hypothetical protein